MFTVKFELKNPPYGFRRGNVVAVNILFHFVMAVLKGDSATVTSLIHVFVDIFSGCKADGTFDINVTEEAKKTEWAVGHNPPVVEHICSHLVCSSIIWP